MSRAPRPPRVSLYRAWALDRRTCQRLAVSGALAAAVSTASWGWVVAAPPPIARPGRSPHPATCGRPRQRRLRHDRCAGGRSARRPEQAASPSTSTSPPAPPAPRSAIASPSSRPPPPRWTPTRSTSPRRSAWPTARTPRRRSCRSGARTSGWSSTTPSARPPRTRRSSRRPSTDLVGYTQDFGAFLSGANENLPKDVVAGLVKRPRPDPQGRHRRPGGRRPEDAVHGDPWGRQPHEMIADPLAEATAAKFPDKFQGGMADPGMPGMNRCTACASCARLRPGRLRGLEALGRGPGRHADRRDQAVRVPAEAAGGPGRDDRHLDQPGRRPAQRDGRGGPFDSGLFGQGETFSQTFDQPGTYAYYCTRHGSMMGEVKVAA